MIHYLFVEGEVVTLDEWRHTHDFASGTFGYTPDDSLATWYFTDPPRWITTTKDQVPKAFLMALLLLGIPIQG